MVVKRVLQCSPLEEGLQAFAAGTWVIVFMFGGVLATLASIYLLAYTRYYLLILAYFVWIYVDRNTSETGGGGRRSEWVRNWSLFQYNRDYFPSRLVKTANLSPSNNYLFACFPHGLLSSGSIACFTFGGGDFTSLFPGLESSLLTVNVNFWFPFLRELLLALGCLSVSERSIIHTLTHSNGGKALVVMVGGMKESFNCKPGTNEVVLKNRKGFVRLALKTGTPLVPVFTFGETDLYDQVSNPLLVRLQNVLHRVTGVTPCFPNGRGLFFLPRRHALTTVVGAPIEVPKVASPSKDLIDEYHKKYMDGLTKLFEDHKGNYVDDPKMAKLVIS